MNCKDMLQKNGNMNKWSKKLRCLGSTIIWAKYVVGGDGLVSFVRYIVYSIVGGKEKLLVPKLDFLLKHSKRRKAIFAM